MRRARQARRVGALAGVALALAVAPACSRTGLDDLETIAARPDGAAGSGVAGGGPRAGDGAASNAGDGIAPPAGEGEAGDFFMSDDSADASENPGDDARAAESDGAAGDNECGPATCAGCCTAGGTCLPGFSNEACGNHGQSCGQCDVERLCNPEGACG